MEHIINKMENLNWNLNWVVEKECENTISFSILTPKQQDFFMSISFEGGEKDFLNNLYDYYKSFDVSYETYMWLDNEGHGKNGAPYDMMDVYHDMEWCKKSILDLYLKLIDNQ